MITKQRFAKVMRELQKKNFSDVLVRIALAQQEMKATKLGFGRIIQEMEKREFARVLEDFAVAK